jgi:tryptophan synthase alpha chain
VVQPKINKISDSIFLTESKPRFAKSTSEEGDEGKRIYKKVLYRLTGYTGSITKSKRLIVCAVNLNTTKNDIMTRKKEFNKISQLFDSQEDNSNILSLFLTAGYPDLESTVGLILGMEKSEADLIELGMPFSDPLADGPTIQASSTKALKNGITMKRIFEMVRQVRKKSEIPIILMGYLNPVLNFGVKQFCSAAKSSGVDGLIIPDLPPEESRIIEKTAANNGLALIYLAAPNTSDERMQLIDSKSQGFVYCVSVTGVTGAREGDQVSRSVNQFIGRAQKNITRNPIMIGFGIKSHEDAQKIAAKANGFIVGSALIDTIRNHYPAVGWQEKVFEFVRELKYG